MAKQFRVTSLSGENQAPDDTAHARMARGICDASLLGTGTGEPSEKELADESRKHTKAKREESPQALSNATRDLLAGYMDQLGKIPLLTPDLEIEHARELELHELKTWELILLAPRAVALLREVAQELEPPIAKKITDLDDSYRRAAARTHKKKLDESPSRAQAVQELLTELRQSDFDKELLELLLTKIRQEVWGRRVLSDNSAYRITHSELTEIERSRGVALRIRNHFVRANLRLVISVARNFHHYRVPFIDLIQEGNVGLMKAVHRFDHKRGFRFSTYAHWWIRQSIERAIINKGSQLRLPVHVIDARRQVNRAAARLHQTFGRPATTEEIAREMAEPLEKVEQILAGVHQDPVSLDESFGGDDSRKFLDLVRDEQTPAIDEALIRENTHDRVRELLHKLNAVERDIIRRRFGLGTDTDQTLDEIGKTYNLSRERVRQIQSQGLAKMRRMCERRQIS